eukprot:7522784-Karenia_brevis.AAC.1
MPDNYCPITLLPILYKLFSRIVCERLRGTLEAEQCADQAGFRSGYSCDDHLLTIVILIELAEEFHLDVWACTVDFTKAFDTVEHASLWNSLMSQGVDARYVNLLAALYNNQVGHIIGKA